MTRAAPASPFAGRPGTLVTMVALVVGLVVAGVVWVTLGPKFVLAPLLGMAVLGWGLATFRSFQRGAHGADLDELNRDPEPVPLDERVVYWCEECGTEVVLVTRGSGLAPRHCGTSMHERTELLR